MKGILDRHGLTKQITTLVENRTVYNVGYSELNVYETHEVAEKISLTFDFPVIASMLAGKKIMHLKGMPAFEFVPGESVVMPANEEMIIDFPEAQLDRPTQCLALGIDPLKINEIVSNFNQVVAIGNENKDWKLDSNSFHLTHQPEVNFLVQRLVKTFTDSNKSKDVLINLMIQELVVRLLQTKARYSLLSSTKKELQDSRIGTVISFIKENFREQNLTIVNLAEKAYMSSSHFHKQFKNTLGVSPIDFINKERIEFTKKAMQENSSKSISEIAYMAGFNSISYYNRLFKRQEGVSPGAYKKSRMGGTFC